MPSGASRALGGLLALAAGFAAAGCGARSDTQVSPAPDFEARALTGKALKLSTLKGKVVLLDFWATWCGPCEETIPRLERLDDRYRAQGLEIVGVSVDDDAGEVPPFVRAHGMRYPVVVDEGKQVMELYNVRAVPTTVLVDRRGRIRARWMGTGDDVVEEMEQDIRSMLDEKGS